MESVEIIRLKGRQLGENRKERPHIDGKFLGR